jgi:riboflavin kinase/FMN adenylyltransferase
VCIPFNAAFAALPPDIFVKDVLIGALKAREWIMGDRHTFGKNQAGNKNFAHTGKGKNDIIILTVKSLVTERAIISSTAIRSGIRHGHISEAVDMLGHPYLIVSRRIAGIKKGTQLGYPTLNFSRLSSHKVLPPSGVYAAELEYKGKRWHGALYFGDCPTFGQRDIHFEFHVFNYSDDVPNEGDLGNLWLYTMVRPDKKFLSSNELVENIRKDVLHIQNFFLQEKEQCR